SSPAPAGSPIDSTRQPVPRLTPAGPPIDSTRQPVLCLTPAGSPIDSTRHPALRLTPEGSPSRRCYKSFNPAFQYNHISDLNGLFEIPRYVLPHRLVLLGAEVPGAGDDHADLLFIESFQGRDALFRTDADSAPELRSRRILSVRQEQV